MKTFKRVILAIFAFLPLVITTAAVLFYLPDQVIAHFDINGNVDRMGSKYEAFILPCVVLVMYAVYMLVRKFSEKSSDDDDKTARNLDIVETVFIAIFAMFGVICVATIIASKEPEIITGGNSLFALIMSTCMGILFIIIGNIIPKSRRNSAVGFRIGFATDTDEHWYIMNRNSGIALVISGIVTIAAGLVLRDMLGFVISMFISLFVTTSIAIIISYAKIKREK